MRGYRSSARGDRQLARRGLVVARGLFGVVGVVEDVHQTALHEDPPAMSYYPMAFTANGSA